MNLSVLGREVSYFLQQPQSSQLAAHLPFSHLHSHFAQVQFAQDFAPAKDCVRVAPRSPRAKREPMMNVFMLTTTPHRPISPADFCRWMEKR